MFKKFKLAISTGLALSIALSGSAFAEDYKQVKITADILNVRESNTTDSQILSRLAKGHVVDVFDQTEDNWYQVQLDGERIAYISADYCEVLSDYITGKINKSVVNFRDKPSTENTKVITKLSENDELKLLSKEGDWYKAQDADGNDGYVFAELVTLDETSTVKEVTTGLNRAQLRLIEVSKAQLGKPYVWAADGPNAFDCSGFVQYVYRQAFGKKLPHSSRTMSTQGTTVKKKDLIVGDLVFFKTSGSSKINHTGIYIGNGEFIHASSSDRNNDSVVISDLTDGYYADVYSWAKRIDY